MILQKVSGSTVQASQDVINDMSNEIPMMYYDCLGAAGWVPTNSDFNAAGSGLEGNPSEE